MTAVMDKYTGLTKERFDLIIGRYAAFQDALNDVNKDPVKVFEPLSKKSLDELNLIREVSKKLQVKKLEDAKKAAQAAEEQAQAAKEQAQAAEKQDGAEENTTETEK